jgi:hypothetical protein
VSARKKHHALAIAAAIAAAYLVLFPFPMERELVAEPAWVLDTTAHPGASSSGSRPFLSGGRVGYYDPAGVLLYSEPLLYGASVGRSAFINYSRLPSSLVVKDARGSFVAAIPAAGYPVLDASGEHVLLVSRDANSLAGVDRTGETLWRLEFASVISSVAFGDWGVLVGLLDGGLALYDMRGRPLYNLKAEGSRIPIILGCAGRADSLACVYGIDPQRLIVVSRKEGRFQQAANLTLESDFRREVLVQFSASANALFFEEPDGLGVLDLGSRIVRRIPLPGPVRTVAEVPGERLWAALHGGPAGGPAGIRIYQAPDRLLARERLPAGADFLSGTAKGFVVGFGSRLLSVEVRRE